MSRFSEKYKNEVAPALMKKFGYSSVMQIPKFNKIVINVGCGDAKENSKVIDNVIEEISLIAGQRAVPTYAHKSVANFKLREGMKIGVKVTLRGERMYHAFLVTGHGLGGKDELVTDAFQGVAQVFLTDGVATGGVDEVYTGFHQALHQRLGALCVDALNGNAAKAHARDLQTGFS